MTYLIDSTNPRAGLRGYSGAGGLGSTVSAEELKISQRLKAGTVTQAQLTALRQAQGVWDAQANKVRSMLANVPGLTVSMVEQELARRLGRRPSVSSIPVATATKASSTPLNLRLRFPTSRVRPGTLPGRPVGPISVQSGADAPEGLPPSGDGGALPGDAPAGEKGVPLVLLFGGAALVGLLVLKARG